MNKELKYCKCCDKEKSIEEFAKSGGIRKYICKECLNKKQRQKYRDSKILNELEKYIVVKLQEFNSPEDYYTLKQIEDIYYRLQELKGSVKE